MTRGGDLLLAGFQVGFLIVYAMIARPGMDEDGRDITSFPWSTHGELRRQELHLDV